VEAAADFIAALLDAAGAERAALVGHSWGSLIALEAAARLKDRVSHLVLIGTAAPMKVSPALLESSLNEPMKALTMINVFSRSTLAAPPSALGPGTWVYGASMALGRRVIASNGTVNVFHRGFKACNDYAGAEAAIAAITCPVLFLLGTQDQMTPPKAAQGLVDTGRKAGKKVSVERVPVGHHQMSEAPDETLAALKTFLVNTAA
jgi:pimeloyl-ACP methyl ester carboxylesterase